MTGGRCRRCGRRSWQIYTDNSIHGFADGALLYARCDNCGRKVTP